MSQSKLHELEAQTGKSIEEILQELFKEHGSQVKVAETIGVSQSTLKYWLLKLGLEQQTILVKREYQR